MKYICIEFGFIRNKDPLNFSTVRKDEIKKALYFQKLIYDYFCLINKNLQIYLKYRDFFFLTKKQMCFYIQEENTNKSRKDNLKKLRGI